jgi:hypothetical protein
VYKDCWQGGQVEIPAAEKYGGKQNEKIIGRVSSHGFSHRCGFGRRCAGPERQTGYLRIFSASQV